MAMIGARAPVYLQFRMAYALIRSKRVPLAETELASQPDCQHDKIAPKPKAPSQIEGFVEQHNYKCFFLKQVTLQLTRRKWRKSQSQSSCTLTTVLPMVTVQLRRK